MSGHSKWSTIKRQKSVTDGRRSAVFTKYGRLITVAARLGGTDPASNFRLRIAIDKARGVNMPNDNIERAIKAGSGEGKEGLTKEVLYEGFGPGGVAVMVQAVTDNSNRTSAEVRNIFSKSGGSMGSHNSVGWMFATKGVVRLPLSILPEDKRESLELELIDAGVDDVRIDEEHLIATTSPEHLRTTKEWLTQQGYEQAEAEVELIPTTTTTLDEETGNKLYRLLETLDELDDVTNVYSNDV